MAIDCVDVLRSTGASFTFTTLMVNVLSKVAPAESVARTTIA